MEEQEVKKKGPNLLAKRKIDFILEEKDNNQITNKYVVKYLSLPFIKEVR